jgi:hypothetical protein
VPGEYVVLTANTAYFREIPSLYTGPSSAGTVLYQGQPLTYNMGVILNNPNGSDVYGNEIDNATVSANIYQTANVLGSVNNSKTPYATTQGNYNPADHTYSIQLDTTKYPYGHYLINATASWQVNPEKWQYNMFAFTDTTSLKDIKLAMVLYDGANDLLWSCNPAANVEAELYSGGDFGGYVNASQLMASGGVMRLYEAAELGSSYGVSYDNVTGRMTTAMVHDTNGVFSVDLYTGNMTFGEAYGIVFFYWDVNSTTLVPIGLPHELWIGTGYVLGTGYTVVWPYSTVTRTFIKTFTVGVLQGQPATLTIGTILANESLPDVYGNEIDNATITGGLYGSTYLGAVGGQFNTATHTYSVQLDTTSLTGDTYTIPVAATWYILERGSEESMLQFQDFTSTNLMEWAMVIYDGANNLLWSSNPAANNAAAMKSGGNFGGYLNATDVMANGGVIHLYEAGTKPGYLGYNVTTGRMTTATVALDTSISKYGFYHYTVSLWTGNLTNGASYGLAFFVWDLNSTTLAPIGLPSQVFVGTGYVGGNGWTVVWPSLLETRGYTLTITVIGVPVTPVTTVTTTAPWYSTSLGLFAIGATVVAVLVAAGLGYTLLRTRRYYKE